MKTDFVVQSRARVCARCIAGCMSVSLAACGGGAEAPAGSARVEPAPSAYAGAPAPGAQAGLPATTTTEVGFADSVIGSADQWAALPRQSAVAGSLPVPMHVVLPTQYSVINLAPGMYGGLPDINIKNQVVMLVENAAGFRSYFFNGQTVRDIGTLGGPYAFASTLNDAGQVSGAATYAGAELVHAFLWREGAGMRDLGTIAGPTSSGLDINETGQIAGISTTAPGGFTRHAFRWSSAGGMRDLGVLPGAATSTAMAINDAGMVVGYSDTRAFAWTPETGMRRIGDDAQATLVNNAGQVAGVRGVTLTTGLHGFVWTAGAGLLDIGTLGGAQSVPAAMNAAGQVVGLAELDSGAGAGAIHAMSWTRAGGMIDLGTIGGGFSSATALNDSGLVVGLSSYTTSTDQEHAFVWSRASGMRDLNKMVPKAPPGLELFHGLAISPHGAIVANSNAGLVLLKPGASATDAPVIGPITAGIHPLPVGRAITFSAYFTDQNITDKHRATWYWGGGCSSGAGTISQANGLGRVTGTHTWCTAGTYWVTLKVTDSTGRATTVARQVAVGAQ